MLQLVFLRRMSIMVSHFAMCCLTPKMVLKWSWFFGITGAEKSWFFVLTFEWESWVPQKRSFGMNMADSLQACCPFCCLPVLHTLYMIDTQCGIYQGTPDQWCFCSLQFLFKWPLFVEILRIGTLKDVFVHHIFDFFSLVQKSIFITVFKCCCLLF